jgi:glycine reductase
VHAPRSTDALLTIDRDTLATLAASDPAFTGVDVILVKPHESVRIPQITDVIEPRTKSGGTGGVFPGVLSPVEPVGTGRTDRLRGVAVVTAGAVPWLGAKGLFVPHDSVLDMDGPGADLHPYADLNLVVLHFHFADGIDHEGYERALLLAGEKVARALALVARDVEPTAVETRALSAPASPLPRIVYAYQVQSQGVFLRSRLYGRVLDELQPSLLHPNELADGALTSGGLGGHGAKMHTWMHQNNALVERLVAGHGTRWDFAGIVLHRGHFYIYEDKQRVALRIAESATLLGANGVVFTLGGAGNNVTEVMLAIQECERRGIKTVLITWEHAGPDGSDYPLPVRRARGGRDREHGEPRRAALTSLKMASVAGDARYPRAPRGRRHAIPDRRRDRSSTAAPFYAGAANPLGFGRSDSVES